MAEVRATILKSNVELLTEDPKTRALVGELDRSDHRVIQEARAFTWIPFEVHVRLFDVLVRGLGTEGTIDFARRLHDDIFAGSVFRSLRTSLKNLGADPAMYLRAVPRGFPMIYRDVGRFAVADDSTQRIVLDYARVPAPCFDHDGAWFYTTAASLAALFRLAGTQGKTQVIDINRSKSRGAFEFTW